jgi:hypothetical protein
LIVIAVLLATVGLLYAPILRGIGDFLIVDQPLQEADFVVLPPNALGSRDARDLAAQLYREGTVRGILVLAPRPSRPVRFGAWPAQATLFRAALLTRGIPAAAITEWSESSNDADTARRLSQLMAGRSVPRLLVLCPPFVGRYERRGMQAAIRELPSVQLYIHALPSAVNRDNWWQTRVGVQEVFHQYMKLAFAAVYGEMNSCRGEWSYEDFEKNLPAPRDDP